MENQEVLKAIATLADKVSRYHERLLAVEREKEKLEKTLSSHLKECSCHNVIKGEPYKPDSQVLVSGLDADIECEACSA